jgi:hypothetical protein
VRHAANLNSEPSWLPGEVTYATLRGLSDAHRARLVRSLCAMGQHFDWDVSPSHRHEFSSVRDCVDYLTDAEADPVPLRHGLLHDAIWRAPQLTQELPNNVKRFACYRRLN